MERKSGLAANILYRIFYADALACIFLFSLGSHFGIADILSVHIAVSLGLIAILTGITYLKLRGRLLLVLGVIGAIVAAVWVTGIDKSMDFIQNYGSWLWNHSTWNSDWLKYYEIIQAALITLVCYFLEVLLEKNILLKKAAAILLLTCLVISMVTNHTLSHMAMTFSCCYIITVFAEGVQNRWIKIKNEDTKRYMLWIAPFLILYFALMCMTPAPTKAYDWKLVKTAYSNIVRVCKIFSQDIARGSGEDFGLSMTGFSEQGLLKGSVSESKEEIMIIKGQPGPVSNIYLMGKVFDAFDGREWKQISESSEEDRILDTIETLYAAQRYGEENIRNYIYSTSSHIKFQYFKTGYLFAPLKTYHAEGKNSGLSYSEEGGNLLLNKRKGYGTEYDVYFFQMNVDHPDFYKFLETKMPDDEEIFHEIRSRYKYRKGEFVEMSDLKAHRQAIYDCYLPQINLSKEVSAYLSEITKGMQTDVEKLKAIEKALLSFSYQADTGNLPEKIKTQEDFLDYFLLEKKEGYCTYFATAFVLLARAEGIPARYVQGFCIPAEGNKETVVYSNMAHAWPEVYIDGAGWIPFEPTPGYAQIRYTPWAMQEAAQSDESMLEGAGQGEHYWESEPSPSILPQDDAEIMNIEDKADGRFGIIVAYTFLFLAVVCILMIMLDGLIGAYRYHKKSLTEQYKIQINRILRILGQLGYERREEETLQELRERAVWLLQEHNEQDRLISLLNYEELLYGSRTVTSEMQDTALEEQKVYMKLLKEKTQKAYFIYKIKLYFLRYR